MNVRITPEEGQGRDRQSAAFLSGVALLLAFTVGLGSFLVLALGLTLSRVLLSFAGALSGVGVIAMYAYTGRGRYDYSE